MAVIAAALTFALVAPVYTGNIAQANAASASKTVATKNLGKVAVKKITNKKVAKNKKATVKPNVKKTGKTKIVKKVITVKRGKKTIAKNKASVKLKAGTYKVTTTVKYKVRVKKGFKTTWSKTKTAKLTQTLKVAKKASNSPQTKYHKITTKAGREEFVKLVNKERKARGLNTIILDSKLTKAAKLYSTGKSADYDKIIDPNFSKKWSITKVTKHMEDGYEVTSTQLRARTFGGVSSSGDYGSVPSDTFFGFLKMDKSLNDFWQKADGVGIYSNGKQVFVIFGILK